MPPPQPGRGAFRIGDWLVQPSLNQIARGETVVRLRPKVMDVLAQLAGTPGEVVSKEAILDAVWSKQYMGDTALSRAVFELREALGDDPQAPAYIETIARRGYRLVAPVAKLAAVPAEPAAPLPRRGTLWSSRRVKLAAGVAAAVTAAILAAGRLGILPRAAAPGRPVKIVVLPFENLGAPDDAYFAAGITDEISGRLVSVEGVSVVSHNSAEHYAGSKMSPSAIGKELGVDFVLGGAIRWNPDQRGSSRVLVMPKLVRVADDTEVWAETYDRILEDIFGLQSELARAVIGQIGLVARSPGGPGGNRQLTTNLGAYQAFLKGHFYADNFYRSEQDLRLGLRMHERAVELDPTFAVAWAEIAFVRATLYHAGFERSDASRAEAQRALDRALGLDATSARVHYDAGFFYYWCYRDYRRALDEFSLARKLSGDSADLRFAEAAVLRREGKWEAAIENLRAATLLDPRGWVIFRELGLTSLFLHRYADAERYLTQTIALAPDESEPYGFLAETYWSWRGDTARAGSVLASMPRSHEARPTQWLFWQDVYRGDLQAALDRLLATSFDVIDVSETWESRGLLLARAYRFLGRSEDARLELEKVRAEMERLVAQRPDDYSVVATYGLSLAALGRKEEAIRAGRRAVELVSARNDLVSTSSVGTAYAEILVMTGEPQQACAQLDALLAMPSRLSGARLRLDPAWAPARSHPCFAALLAKHSSDTGDDRAKRGR